MPAKKIDVIRYPTSFKIVPASELDENGRYPDGRWAPVKQFGKTVMWPMDVDSDHDIRRWLRDNVQEATTKGGRFRIREFRGKGDIDYIWEGVVLPNRPFEGETYR